MVRNNIIALLFTFSLFVMAGCGHNPKDDTEPEQLISVNFSTMSMLGEDLLKSAATAEEDLITKIILFGINDEGAVITNIPAFTGVSLSGTQHNISGLSKNVTSLYAIANPSVTMEMANPSNVTDLMAMTGNFVVAPQSPFLMSCISEVNSASINLQFVRTVAKVNITGLPGFVIDSVRVVNTPSVGYVFNRESFSVPTSSKVSYSYPVGNPSIYIAESSLMNPVQFLVKGRYQNKPDSLTFSLTGGSQITDIVRNTYYHVNVGFN